MTFAEGTSWIFSTAVLRKKDLRPNSLMFLACSIRHVTATSCRPHSISSNPHLNVDPLSVDRSPELDACECDLLPSFRAELCMIFAYVSGHLRSKRRLVAVWTK